MQWLQSFGTPPSREQLRNPFSGQKPHFAGTNALAMLPGTTGDIADVIGFMKSLADPQFRRDLVAMPEYSGPNPYTTPPTQEMLTNPFQSRGQGVAQMTDAQRHALGLFPLVTAFHGSPHRFKPEGPKPSEWYGGKAPSEMTADEFVDLHRTGHISSDAYNSLTKPGGLDFLGPPSKYPNEVGQIDGLSVRMSGNRKRYTRLDADGFPVRSPSTGLAEMMTPDEIRAKGLPEFEQTMVVFDGNKPVAYVDNEFGAVGLWVSDDYQRRGIGSRLLADFMKQNPGMRLGQMTNAGENVTRSVHEILSREVNPYGRFRSSQIGTGEGAQAYGYGHYVAENPDVAKSYKFVNTDDFSARIDDARRQFNSPFLDDLFEDAYEMDLGQLRKKYLSSDYIPDELGERPAWLVKQYEDAINRVQEIDSVGNLYTVDIPDEAIDRMLDWDKPLSEQPESVQRALMNLPNSHKFKPEWTGAQLYESSLLVPGDVRNPEAASAALNKAGIPGIRYLDQGSRAATSVDSAHLRAARSFMDSGTSVDDALRGMRSAYPDISDSEVRGALEAAGFTGVNAGTRNFVVFDEDLITIKGRQ